MRTEIDQKILGRYLALAHMPDKTIARVTAYELDETGAESVVFEFTDGSSASITSAEPYDHQSWLNVKIE